MEKKTSEIVETECERFINLPQEKLLVAKREYWLFAFIPILFTVGFFFMLLIAAVLVFLWMIHSLFLLIVTSLVLLNAAIGIIAKIYIHWYFHIYIVTTRKLLEVNYSPLDTLMENEVLLDQVRCTEVDMRRGGLLHELLDFGTIRITFDRPTHRQEFILSNIKHHRRIGNILSNMLVQFEPSAGDLGNPLRYYVNRNIRRA